MIPEKIRTSGTEVKGFGGTSLNCASAFPVKVHWDSVRKGAAGFFLNYPTRICKTLNRCVLSLWWVDETLDVPPKVPKALNNSLGTQTEGMVRWPEMWSQTSKESGSILNIFKLRSA